MSEASPLRLARGEVSRVRLFEKGAKPSSLAAVLTWTKPDRAAARVISLTHPNFEPPPQTIFEFQACRRAPKRGPPKPFNLLAYHHSRVSRTLGVFIAHLEVLNGTRVHSPLHLPLPLLGLLVLFLCSRLHLFFLVGPLFLSPRPYATTERWSRETERQRDREESRNA